MVKTTVYAVRDAETKERLTYRHRAYRDALQRLHELNAAGHTGRVLEVYRTSQDLPRQNRR